MSKRTKHSTTEIEHFTSLATFGTDADHDRNQNVPDPVESRRRRPSWSYWEPDYVQTIEPHPVERFWNSENVAINLSSYRGAQDPVSQDVTPAMALVSLHQAWNWHLPKVEINRRSVQWEAGHYMPKVVELLQLYTWEARELASVLIAACDAAESEATA